jgi:DNA-directed RNA polymerase subunit omega
LQVAGWPGGRLHLQLSTRNLQPLVHQSTFGRGSAARRLGVEKTAPSAPVGLYPIAPRQLLKYPVSSYYSQKQPLMNGELVRQALEKVGNANFLVNLISRRVRQLNFGAGATSRPLVADTGNLGVADIALREIVEGKMGWEIPELVELTRPVGKKRRKH